MDSLGTPVKEIGSSSSRSTPLPCATVDWLIVREGVEPTLEAIKEGIRNWPAGPSHAERKVRLFNDRLLELSLERLKGFGKSE